MDSNPNAENFSTKSPGLQISFVKPSNCFCYHQQIQLSWITVDEKQTV